MKSKDVFQPLPIVLTLLLVMGCKQNQNAEKDAMTTIASSQTEPQHPASTTESFFPGFRDRETHMLLFLHVYDE